MKILFLGDIVGANARSMVCGEVPRMREGLGLDAVVVNGENAAHGFGITEKIARDLLAAGVDAITTGNHVWNQPKTPELLTLGLPIVRPLNYPEGTPGRGVVTVTLKNGKRLAVMQLMGRQFMEPIEDPFLAFDRAAPRLMAGVDALAVDFHAEATSEKAALGHYVNGRATMLAGTHTHVPTADWRVLSRGTAYITDAGMCGDYDSVIGMDKTEPVNRFITQIRHGKLSPSEGPATLAGVILETDDGTGLAVRIDPFRKGPNLSNTIN